MKIKNLLTSASLVCSLGVGITGCSSTQQPVPSQQSAQTAPTQQQNNQANQSGASSTAQLERGIKDELNGLNIIEVAVNKGDFAAASKIFEPLHDEFHTSVLPPIETKNPQLAKDMHSKFDMLDSSLDTKDKNKIISAIKTNRDSLTQAAKKLGISI